MGIPSSAASRPDSVAARSCSERRRRELLRRVDSRGTRGGVGIGEGRRGVYFCAIQLGMPSHVGLGPGREFARRTRKHDTGTRPVAGWCPLQALLLVCVVVVETVKGLIGSLHQPLARLTGCSLNLFGYLHEVASLTPAVQKVPTSLAPEERGNRSHAVSPAAVMQEQAWGQRPDKQK